MNIKKKLLAIITMSLFSLLIIDLLVGVFISGFSYSPQGNKLKAYFSYGYSTKTKLLALVAEDDSASASIAKAGWYSELPSRNDNESSCRVDISIYGMSFTNRIGLGLEKLNECFAIRYVAGPGAPLSHSIYTFDQFKQDEDSEYIVIGVLASALPKINTVAHFNSAFEYPGSHMYPRYYFKDGHLESSGVPFKSLQEVRRALLEPAVNNSLVGFLDKHDAYFDPLVFGYSWADYSVVLRMLRRSYAQNNKRNKVANYIKGAEFTNFHSMTDVSRAILKKFVLNVKAIGKQPVVILINDKGYAESLDAVFVALLDELNVKYFSSTGIIDSLNYNNFQPDGHFTPENDMKLSAALSQILLKLEE